MILTKRKNGRYYIVYTQSNGKRTGISTGTKIKSEALKFLTQFEKELNEKRIQRLKPISLKEYCEQFLSYSKQIHTQKTYEGYLHSLKYLQKYFGNIHLNEITLSLFNKYFENRLKTSSIYMARKDMICFNSCLNKAIAEGYLLSNPLKVIKPFKLPEKQPLFFSELDFDLLMNVIVDKDIKDLVLFALQTGLRQMEIIFLKWNQINFKDRILTLNNQNSVTKSKKIRTIPLSLKALQILSDRGLFKKSEFVFTINEIPFNQDSVRYQFKKYVRIAKINPKLKFHSLRHTFASWLVQKGVSIYHVSKLLGHANVETTEIYSHLRAEDLRTAINVLNN